MTNQLKKLLSREDVFRTHKMDSLQNALKYAKNDTELVNIYYALCEACDVKENLKYAALLLNAVDKSLMKNITDSERSWLYKRKAEALNFEMVYYQSISQTNSPHYKRLLDQKHKLYLLTKNPETIVESFIEKADYFESRSEKIQQLNALKEGLNYFQKTKYYKGQNQFNQKLSFFFANVGDTAEAIRYYEDGKKIETIIGDSSRMKRNYFVAGVFYSEIKLYQKSLEYLEKSLQYAINDKDTTSITQSYYSMAEAHYSLKAFDKAKMFAERSASLSEKTANYQYYFLSLKILGQISLQNKNISEAIKYHSRLMEIAIITNSDEPMLVANLLLARDYFYSKEFNKAKEYSGKAVYFSKKRSLQAKIDCEFLAYRVDSALQNFKGALGHYQKYVELKEKSGYEQLLKISEREKFNRDLEKQNLANKIEQEKKDVLNAKEKQKQRLVLYSVSIVLLLLTILIVFVLRGYRQKQKANQELTSKNEVIAHQKLLVEEKHREITDSISYAERIQRSFLASKELLSNYLKEYFIFFRPRDIVSGDFYWAAEANGLFYLALCDSTGHGVPGAIMSILNITSIENALKDGLASPAEIFNSARKNIIERLSKDGSAEGGKDGMDGALMAFDFNKKMLYVAAANNPVWIIRNKQIIEIKPDKMPIGKHEKENISFTAHEINIMHGDVIYTFTDGFPDQFGGEKGKKFMIKNLRNLLLENVHLSMDSQKEIIQKTFLSWKGKIEQVDDVGIIGIRV